MSEEEVKQLRIERDNAILERDTAIFVAKERLDIIERIKNQKEIFELRYLKADKEIERLNKRILTLEETIRKANNNVIKDIAMIKTHEMVKQEIVQRLIETSKILESGSDEE